MIGMSIASLRRWLPFVIVLAGVLVAAAIPAVQMVTWVGHKTLQVEVRVIETDSPRAIAGAEVTIFDGPQSPIDGLISGRRSADFEPNLESSETKTAVT